MAERSATDRAPDLSVQGESAAQARRVPPLPTESGLARGGPKSVGRRGAPSMAIGALPVDPSSIGDGVSGTSPASLRHRILVQLRLDGSSSPDALAARLGASRTGVLQQLRSLEAAGLVTRTAERHGVGRPRHRYDVTGEAQRLFPAAYDGLAAGLLTAVAEVGGEELLERVFRARRDRQAAHARARLDERLPPGATLLDRVRELAAIQDENGYLAEVALDPDGVIRLRERNCAIHQVARSEPAACAAELALFAEVLEAEVTRESHIATGDRCCSYAIRPLEH